MVKNDREAGDIRDLFRDNNRPDYIVRDSSEAVDLILKLDSAVGHSLKHSKLYPQWPNHTAKTTQKISKIKT